MTDIVQGKCERCKDDGWVEVLDDDGFPVGARECPRLGDPGHAPFDATGLLAKTHRGAT